MTTCTRQFASARRHPNGVRGDIATQFWAKSTRIRILIRILIGIEHRTPQSSATDVSRTRIPFNFRLTHKRCHECGANVAYALRAQKRQFRAILFTKRLVGRQETFARTVMLANLNMRRIDGNFEGPQLVQLVDRILAESEEVDGGEKNAAHILCQVELTTVCDTEQRELP